MGEWARRRSSFDGKGGAGTRQRNDEQCLLSCERDFVETTESGDTAVAIYVVGDRTLSFFFEIKRDKEKYLLRTYGWVPRYSYLLVHVLRGNTYIVLSPFDERPKY